MPRNTPALLSPHGHLYPYLYIPLINLGHFHALHVACDVRAEAWPLMGASYTFTENTIILKPPRHCIVTGTVKLQVNLNPMELFTMGHPMPRFRLILEEYSLGPPATRAWDTWVHIEYYLWLAALVALGVSVYRAFPLFHLGNTFLHR